MANRFVLNETSYHGSGAIKDIAVEIKGRGFIGSGNEIIETQTYFTQPENKLSQLFSINLFNCWNNTKIIV